MTTLLGLDVGSSSVKTGILRGGRLVGRVGRVAFRTRYAGPRVEVDAGDILAAVRAAIRALGPRARRVDAVAISVMSPSWVVMDARGEPLTPVVTHQDRRSVAEAVEIERRVGRDRHLSMAGNRPCPGGISSTTWAWYRANEPQRLRRAALVGQLSTLLVHRLTGARAIDPSNASFTGLYSVPDLGGWSAELCDVVGLPMHLLPDVMDADRTAGTVTRDAARAFGVTAGTPVLAGIVDGSAAMLLAGARVGQVLNVSGSTDVLALCTSTPRPSDRYITRALGVGRAWLSVSTLAAAGSALDWARAQLFPDLPEAAYWRLVGRLAGRAGRPPVTFDPYLAGERTSVEQRTAAFAGLTLATTREDLLWAVIDALATASAARLADLRTTGTPIRRDVTVAGGVGRRLARVLHRDWGHGWRFTTPPPEATLRGLGRLVPGAR